MTLVEDLRKIKEAGDTLGKVAKALYDVAKEHGKFNVKIHKAEIEARKLESRQHDIQRHLASARDENTRAALTHNLSQISNSIAQLNSIRSELENAKRAYIAKIDHAHSIAEVKIHEARA